MIAYLAPLSVLGQMLSPAVGLFVVGFAYGRFVRQVTDRRVFGSSEVVS